MSGLQAILDKATYQEYLRRLDGRALLEHYDAANMTEQTNHQDGSVEVMHSCLLDRVEPHHANGDQNPSACVNLDKKLFVCYAMGFGCDLFHLVMKLEGLESLAESLTVIGQFLTGSTLDTQTLRQEMEKAFAATNAYALSLPSYDRSVLTKWLDMPHDYWATRGITEGTQCLLDLGYDDRAKRIVFPHYVDGTLVGWQKRVVPELTTEDLGAKYKNSPGFPKSETLYHHDRAKTYEQVIVVESPMSVAKAVSLGVPNVVSTFGAKVGEHQIKLLRPFERVYVWFDRDGAGLQGEKKLVEGLFEHTDVRVVAPDGGKDLGDCTSEEDVFVKLYAAKPGWMRLGEYASWKKLH